MTSEFDVRDEFPAARFGAVPLPGEGPVEMELDLEGERFAEALLTLEVGGTPADTANDDPELASLIRTVAFLRADAHAATETASYRSYHARSRAYVLHTLEQRAASTPDPTPSVEVRSVGIVTRIDRFLQRHRRVTFATPVAAAAAAAALFLFGAPASAPAGGEPRPAIAQNQTAATADAELARIQFTLAAIANRSASGQTVDATLLRAVTETASAVANRIETAPQTLSREHVANYQRTIATGNFVLSLAQPTAGSEDALAAAQRAAQDGQVTAARFLSADEPAAAPQATSAASSTATPVATPAITTTPTPEATVRP